MVKMLSSSDKEAIAQAIAEAECATSAEIVTVIAPISDTYQGYILLYGLTAGSLIDIGLWFEKLITDFPYLLVIQLAVMLLLSLVPGLRHLCVKLVPARIARHRAAHRAYEEYLVVSRHVPATTPIVLFYVSRAERYAHILPSRAVREKITEECWSEAIREFTSSIASAGLQKSAVDAIRRMAALLAQPFPGLNKINSPAPSGDL